MSLWLREQTISVSMLTTHKLCCLMGSLHYGQSQDVLTLGVTVICSVLKAAQEQHWGGG